MSIRLSVCAAVTVIAAAVSGVPALAASEDSRETNVAEQPAAGQPAGQGSLARYTKRARVTQWSGDYFTTRYKVRVIDKNYDNYWGRASWQLRSKGRVVATRGNTDTVYFRLPPGDYVIKKMVRNTYPQTDTVDEWRASACRIENPVYQGTFRWTGTVTCGGPDYYTTYSGQFDTQFFPDGGCYDWYDGWCYDWDYEGWDPDNPPTPRVKDMGNPEAIQMRLVAHDRKYYWHKTWFSVRHWNYKNVTTREANAVRIGMTKAQVRAIFGTPGDTWLKAAGRECRTYDDWVNICYSNGKVAVLTT